jgi:hypothetical protein
MHSHTLDKIKEKNHKKGKFDVAYEEDKNWKMTIKTPKEICMKYKTAQTITISR